ncbi:MAG: lamin tail domain-containing protein [Salinivirgaceae bacterium]|jgi:hypothetical protein
MKLFLPLSMLFLTALYATAQTPTDLFFSEYVEGSGNNKAVEIYNPTSQTIDLSNYYVMRFSNGSSTFAEGGATHLSGTLAPYATFVLVNGQTTSTSSSPACSPELQAMANQLDGAYPAPTYMNGNDAIALVKTPGGVAPSADMSNVTSVDLIGQIGQGATISAQTGWSYVKDSTLTYNNTAEVAVTGKVINYIVQAKATDGTTFGPYWMSWTSDHVLIRKYDIVKGVVANPNPFIVNVEWDTVPAIKDTAGHWVYKDIWTNLGKHACAAHGVGFNESPIDSWLTIYPNPALSGHFTIESEVSIQEVEIYSAIGQLVYKQYGTNNQFRIEIAPATLKKGMYLVKVITSKKETSVKKIMLY